MTETITQAQYRAFQQAYDFFNAELFAGSLPHVLVTLQRHAKAIRRTWSTTAPQFLKG